VATRRTELLTIRVTEDEMRMLKELADVDGITASDVVRMFVRHTHAERFGAEKRTRFKPKK
jgi:hypothetical protein